MSTPSEQAVEAAEATIEGARTMGQYGLEIARLTALISTGGYHRRQPDF